MYSKLVGIGSLAVILALGFYFNWPRDGTTQAIAQIAPDFANIVGYININTPPTHTLTLASLHGSIVLLHFWRIGCPDCQNDVPFINAMYAKYHAYGLQVIGIHSAQFEYEKDQTQVQNFVTQHGIKYPVLMDSTKATWNLYGDSYWPRDALVSKAGYITWTHIGAGDNYNREMAIRTELAVNH